MQELTAPVCWCPFHVPGRWPLSVQHLLLFLAFLFLPLRFGLRLGLGHFATGLGDGARLLAVCVVQGSLQTSGSGLQGRVQACNWYLHLAPNCFFLLQGILHLWVLMVCLQLSSGGGALPGAQSAVSTGGHTHAPLPFTTVRLLHFFSWFLFLPCFSGAYSCQNENALLVSKIGWEGQSMN